MGRGAIIVLHCLRKTGPRGKTFYRYKDGFSYFEKGRGVKEIILKLQYMLSNELYTCIDSC